MPASDPTRSMRLYWRRGEPFVWLTASALATVTMLAVAFVVVILANALGFFWPGELTRLELRDGRVMLGEIVETVGAGDAERLRLKVGNRDLYGQDFVWIDGAQIAERSEPADAVALERLEYGHFYGFLVGESWQSLQARLDATTERLNDAATTQAAIAAVNRRMEALTGRRARLLYDGGRGKNVAAELQQVERDIVRQETAFHELQDELFARERAIAEHSALFRDVGGREKTIALSQLVRTWRPNVMSFGDKAGFYLDKAWELFADEPRESNTEGGVFPAIFGTVMMVLLMSLFSIPLGVIAAVYLREYAREGRIVTLVRISVNNLAGVPSIVYGVFGLGFFVYTVGAAIDRAFFPHLLPTPTYGTGGILWASLTLALLTVPVVIVATEEALSAIPKEIREGSLALGATKFQTLTRILLPMSTPGILTGMILAMARAAGEVAPLMLTGAVKLAPQLPLDGNFPYFHLDRKFMHLGFHIYDLGFQSPNVEAVLPMVYVTTTVLLGIVIVLATAAIVLRNRMRKRYTVGVF